MNKHLKVFLTLVVLAIAAAAGLYHWSQRGVILLGDPSWPGVQLAALSRIEVNAPKRSYAFVERNGVWYVESGGKTQLADEQKIQALLDSIAKTPPKQHVGRFTSRGQNVFGLERARPGITLLGDTLLWGIVLGEDGPNNGTVYARSSLQGDQVYLLDARYREMFSHPQEFFADQRIVSAVAEKIVRVQVEGPGAGMWEIKRKNDGFVFTAPELQIGHTVAQTKMELYLQTLASLRSAPYTGERPEVLPPPQLKVAVWTENDDEPETVVLYHSGDGKQAFLGEASRHSGLVEVAADQAEKLSISAFYLRKRPVVEADLGEAVTQRIMARRHGAVREYVALKGEKGWYESVSGLAITGLDLIMWQAGALQFVDKPVDKAPENVELALTWQFLNADDKPLAVLYFYTDPLLPAGRCWVKVLGEDTWFPVSKQLLDDVLSRLPAPVQESKNATDG